VRELENIIQHAVALTEGSKLTPEDLPARLRKYHHHEHGYEEDLVPLQEVEKHHIARVLERTGHNIKAACRILDLPRTTLWRRMKKYNLLETPEK
jgi:transcriptional regulator of acetoin/glycerol metabolism